MTFLRSVGAQITAETRMRLRSPATAVTVVGSLPSVCVLPAGKSVSVSSTFAVVEPGGTVAVQLPFESVVTVWLAPFESVMTTSTFARSGSPVSWVPLPLLSV